MGTWGYEPKGNDSSCDLLYEVEEGTIKQLRQIFNFKCKRIQDQWHYVGLVQLLLERGTWLPLRFIKMCCLWLTKIERDREWQEDWRDPAKLRRAIKRIKNLMLRLKEVGDQYALAGKKQRKIKVKGRRLQPIVVGYAALPNTDYRPGQWFQKRRRERKE